VPVFIRLDFLNAKTANSIISITYLFRERNFKKLSEPLFIEPDFLSAKASDPIILITDLFWVA
jgi:hypothetical protein